MALSDEQILVAWAKQDEQFIRPILEKNQILAFARAIESEVRKQDTELIRQMVEALEGSIAITMAKIDQRNAAITAGRARLEASHERTH